jgi:putative sterol carrier protein
VYRAFDINNNICCVKIIDENKFDKEEWNSAFRFKESKCKYLIRYENCKKVTFADKSYYALIMEYCSGGV